MIHTPRRPLRSGEVRDSDREFLLEPLDQIVCTDRLVRFGEASPAADSVMQSWRNDLEMRNHQTMDDTLHLSVESTQPGPGQDGKNTLSGLGSIRRLIRICNLMRKTVLDVAA